MWISTDVDDFGAVLAEQPVPSNLGIRVRKAER
jgi:hypothetical protein